MLNRPSTTCLFAVFLVSFVLSAGCNVAEELWDWPQRAKQIRTQGVLQGLSAQLEHARSEQDLDLNTIQGIIADSDRRDAWGNQILVAWRSAPEGAPSSAGTYLLVSRGSDGRLDVPNIEFYFEAEGRVWVGGDFPRDIVFRDNHAIQSGGK